MTFNSLQYLVFGAVVLLAYWRLTRRGQNVLLLAASYVFYAAFDVRFLGLLLLSTGLDFWFGRSLDATDTPRARKRWLIASIAVNLGILGVFKYYDFFAGSAAPWLRHLGLDANPPLLRVVLPVGISFYTFHGISYVFDVYRRHIKPTKSVLDYAVFVAFFPQLVAGPIGRAQLQLPQFGRDRTAPAQDEVFESLTLIATGLVKKVVIADGVAGFVSTTFGATHQASALTLVVAAWGFALQIYGDFSGYTDIARGSARLLGIGLPENFRQPYLSRSITEFWRRWHISLSNWLRDYLYIPLGGNQDGRIVTYRNLMITMLLGGLWHGAAWTFVVWGGIHGALLGIERALGWHRADANRHFALRDIPRALVTANLVCGAFVVFRAATLSDAVAYMRGILTLRGGLAVNMSGLSVVLVAAAVTLALDLRQRARAVDKPRAHLRPEMAGALAALAAVSVLVFSGGTPVPFIYFRF